ncbi:Flavodoxin family protein, partial [Dysosmobacter welbionis]
RRRSLPDPPPVPGLQCGKSPRQACADGTRRRAPHCQNTGPADPPPASRAPRARQSGWTQCPACIPARARFGSLLPRRPPPHAGLWTGGTQRTAHGRPGQCASGHSPAAATGTRAPGRQPPCSLPGPSGDRTRSGLLPTDRSPPPAAVPPPAPSSSCGHGAYRAHPPAQSEGCRPSRTGRPCTFFRSSFLLIRRQADALWIRCPLVLCTE